MRYPTRQQRNASQIHCFCRRIVGCRTVLGYQAKPERADENQIRSRSTAISRFRGRQYQPSDAATLLA